MDFLQEFHLSPLKITSWKARERNWIWSENSRWIYYGVPPIADNKVPLLWTRPETAGVTVQNMSWSLARTWGVFCYVDPENEIPGRVPCLPCQKNSPDRTVCQSLREVLHKLMSLCFYDSYTFNCTTKIQTCIVPHGVVWSFLVVFQFPKLMTSNSNSSSHYTQITLNSTKRTSS